MKIFVSSVRRGLEDERDALPGLIRALGHEPRRFEDYTARSVPSREACLRGVEDSDAYVLLLGEHYGDLLPDTGKSPTEEEWTVAKRRGIPIVAFRKRGVDLEASQADFMKRVEDYAAGVLRGSFADVGDLLIAVAAAVRELEAAPTRLRFEPLTGPLGVPWRAFDHGAGWRNTPTTVELHAIPVVAAQLGAVALAALPARLTRVGREQAFFTDDQALDAGVEEAAAFASSRSDQHHPFAGIRVGATGTVSVWREMPSDMLGVILDQTDVAARISVMLRVAAEVQQTSGSVALAVALYGLASVAEGSATDLGRRSSASLAGFRGPIDGAQVGPRDSVPASTLATAAAEIGNELAMRLLLRFREVAR